MAHYDAKLESRELLFFEWVMIDNCNLYCSYCVNKGEYSHKTNDKMIYVSGKEIDIANQIVKLSHKANKVFVNITGGEPFLSDRFLQVLSIFAAKDNIVVNVISNLKLLAKHADDILQVNPALHIWGSLHVKYRSDHEIRELITFLNAYKGRLNITLSQVDHELTLEERGRIADITEQTGLPVTFQKFIPPWTEDGKVENEDDIRDATFVSSLGKRCCLGYSHFFILPDGTFYYDQWCNEDTRKTGNVLELSETELDAYILNGMKRCQKNSCGCNYNTFNYEEYLAACTRLGYPDEEVFGRSNLREEVVTGEDRPQNSRSLIERIRKVFQR